MKYTARSASDRTDDWPFWFIADERGLNVTVKLIQEMRGYLPFLSREVAELIVTELNQLPASSDPHNRTP